MAWLMRTLPTSVRIDANANLMVSPVPASFANWQGGGGRNNQTISVGKLPGGPGASAASGAASGLFGSPSFSASGWSRRDGFIRAVTIRCGASVTRTRSTAATSPSMPRSRLGTMRPRAAPRAAIWKSRSCAIAHFRQVAWTCRPTDVAANRARYFVDSI